MGARGRAAAVSLGLLLVALSAFGAPGAGQGAPADLHAVVRLSEPFDLCHDDHLRLVASGRTLFASWESDHDAVLYPEAGAKMEMGWAARFNGGGWSQPMPASYAQGVVHGAHYGRSGAAADHFLVGYNLEGDSISVARFGFEGVLPSGEWTFGPAPSSVVMRPWPAEWNGVDFASVLTNDPAWAGAGGRAALLLRLDGGGPPQAEVIARAGAYALVDAALFNWSGTLAALLEVEPEQMAPHELWLTLRGEAGNWSAPRPVAGAAGGLSSTNVGVLVVGGRPFVAYERARSPETPWSAVVLAELLPGGEAREAVVSPQSGAHSHSAPSLAAMGGKVFVAWSTDDDGLGLGRDVDAYYRAVDLADWTAGPIRPLNPPDSNASDSRAAVASDGSRLFGAWVTDNPAYLDGLDTDVVARYLEGDFDGDGVLDEADEDPARPAAAEAAPAPASSLTAAAAASAGAAGVGLLLWRRGRLRGGRAPP